MTELLELPIDALVKNIGALGDEPIRFPDSASEMTGAKLRES